MAVWENRMRGKINYTLNTRLRQILLGKKEKNRREYKHDADRRVHLGHFPLIVSAKPLRHIN
jgi:hypothetical protein